MVCPVSCVPQQSWISLTSGFMHVGVACLMTLVLPPQSVCAVASISSDLHCRMGRQWTHFRTCTVAIDRQPCVRPAHSQDVARACKALASLRLSAHDLDVETAKWSRPRHVAWVLSPLLQ